MSAFQPASTRTIRSRPRRRTSSRRSSRAATRPRSTLPPARSRGPTTTSTSSPISQARRWPMVRTAIW